MHIKVKVLPDLGISYASYSVGPHQIYIQHRIQDFLETLVVYQLQIYLGGICRDSFYQLQIFWAESIEIHFNKYRFLKMKSVETLQSTNYIFFWWDLPKLNPDNNKLVGD